MRDVVSAQGQGSPDPSARPLMTAEQRAAARERCAGVCSDPVPWQLIEFTVYHGDDFPLVTAVEHGQADMGWTLKAMQFMVAAREDLPAALATIDALGAELARTRALNEQLANRVAAQSELLTRRARRPGGG